MLMPLDHQKSLTAYRNLMLEVKARLEAAHLFANGEHNLNWKLAEEFCYLQLRYACEGVALGCLVAHNDIPEVRTGKTLKKYTADGIIGKLEKLHPAFFPIAVEAQSGEPDVSFHMAEPKREYMTKSEFLRLYRRCGTILHRGSLKKALSGPIPDADMGSVRKSLNRLLGLVAFHRIELITENMLIANLYNGDAKEVFVAHCVPS